MFLGSNKYQEGHFRPERGGSVNWDVWCHAGALQVLAHSEYVEWLNCHLGDSYIINFANGAAASIYPAHPLWQVLVEISKNYQVEVFRISLTGNYEAWSGDEKSLRQFDAIRIKKKEA